MNKQEKAVGPYNAVMENGMLINVYSDHIYNKKFEGVARLIELKEPEHSYIKYDEALLTKKENKVSADGERVLITKREKANNFIYNKLHEAFYGTDRYSMDTEFGKVVKYLKKHVKKTSIGKEKLYNIVIYYQFLWSNTIYPKRALFRDTDPHFIVDFIYQTSLKNWAPTIYRTEKWKVEFIPSQFCIKTRNWLYDKPFTTTRKFGRIMCINPNQDAQNCKIRFYSTGTEMHNLGSTVSNFDRKKRNIKIEDNDV